MNCPICDKIIDNPTNIIGSNSYYRCDNFFVRINPETNKFTELYLYQKPIIVYFQHVEPNAPNWSVSINAYPSNANIIHKENGYLSVEEAKRQFKRYKKLLILL